MTFKEILRQQKEKLTGISTKEGTKIVTYKEKLGLDVLIDLLEEEEKEKTTKLKKDK
tara:strand:+ start:607 stop:777 length:171 start_codon:yes stop_codon:yes gene_type:complete